MQRRAEGEAAQPPLLRSRPVYLRPWHPRTRVPPAGPENRLRPVTPLTPPVRAQGHIAGHRCCKPHRSSRGEGAMKTRLVVAAVLSVGLVAVTVSDYGAARDSYQRSA